MSLPSVVSYPTACASLRLRSAQGHTICLTLNPNAGQHYSVLSRLFKKTSLSCLGVWSPQVSTRTSPHYP
jgi:hypothetical protein